MDEAEPHGVGLDQGSWEVCEGWANGSAKGFSSSERGFRRSSKFDIDVVGVGRGRGKMGSERGLRYTR